MDARPGEETLDISGPSSLSHLGPPASSCHCLSRVQTIVGKQGRNRAVHPTSRWVDVGHWDRSERLQKNGQPPNSIIGSLDESSLWTTLSNCRPRQCHHHQPYQRPQWAGLHWTGIRASSECGCALWSQATRTRPTTLCQLSSWTTDQDDRLSFRRKPKQPDPRKPKTSSHRCQFNTAILSTPHAPHLSTTVDNEVDQAPMECGGHSHHLIHFTNVDPSHSRRYHVTEKNPDSLRRQRWQHSLVPAPIDFRGTAADL